MYAVIKTGGKQYRVAPGDTVRIEKAAHEEGAITFSDIVAVSGEEGKFESDLGGAKVVAEVVSEGRGDKILVFHYKRKKQYKKMQGHRQSFVEVKINEIVVGGKSFKAPELEKKQPKPKKAAAMHEHGSQAHEHETKTAKAQAKKKAAPKKSAKKKSAKRK